MQYSWVKYDISKAIKKSEEYLSKSVDDETIQKEGGDDAEESKKEDDKSSVDSKDSVVTGMDVDFETAHVDEKFINLTFENKV